jgi:hypothetical protein
MVGAEPTRVREYGWTNESPDPVTSAVVHPTASVLATCSGQKQYQQFHEPHSRSFVDQTDKDEDSNSRTELISENGHMDNTLRIWAL